MIRRGNMIEKLKELKELVEHFGCTDIEDKNNKEKAHNIILETIDKFIQIEFTRENEEAVVKTKIFGIVLHEITKSKVHKHE